MLWKENILNSMLKTYLTLETFLKAQVVYHITLVSGVQYNDLTFIYNVITR